MARQGDDGRASPKRKTRVLHVLVGLTIGGAESLIADLVPRLDREAYDVTVCSLKGWGPIGDRLARRGVKVVALGGKGRVDPRVISRFASFIRRERYDIVHSHLYLANLISRLVGRLLRVPIIISSQHGTEIWMRWYHLLLERTTVHCADHVTGCSESVRDYAVDVMGADRRHSSVLHNGVDLDRFALPPDGSVWRERWGIPSDALVAGVVGRLALPEKGQDLFLAAAGEVAEAFPRAYFVIVGEGPCRPELERIAREVGISDRVIFDSTQDEVPRMMAAFDLAVLPSRREGFGIVLLEAMASRKPVVATNVGGIPEIIEDGLTGMLVPPCDAPALARAMVRLLSDRQQCDMMGEEGRRRVEASFGIEKTAARLESLYRSLSGEKARRSHAEDVRGIEPRGEGT